MTQIRHTKSYIKGHPNPQFTRDNFLLLDGSWDFAFDSEKKINKNNMLDDSSYDRTIKVPYSYQYEKSTIGIKDRVDHLAYRKVFSFKKRDDKRVILHFDGVDYKARVYLNGCFLGEHIGAYNSFSFDITEEIQEGNNILNVLVYDDYKSSHPRGKQKSMNDNYECFYLETSGIYKSVWIEQVGETYLKDVKMNASLKDSRVDISYDISDLNVEDELYMTTKISFEDEQIVISSVKLLRDEFSSSYDITTEKSALKLALWNPSFPHLYDVVFTITDKRGNVIDKVRSYFGVATYTTSSNNIYLNNEQLLPKLILNQGYSKDGGLSLDEDEIVDIIEKMKEIDLNGCRVHQKIESQLFYYYCDVLGFLMWEELPSIYTFTQKAKQEVVSEWIKIVEAHQNHPSIMARVIANETWGFRGLQDNQDKRELLDGLYHITKAISNNALVISNDGWEHTTSDIITLHNYASEYYELYKNYHGLTKDDIKEDYKRCHTGPRMTFVKEEYGCFDKPIMLTEFGGIAFDKDRDTGWGYGDMVKGEDEYLARLKGLIDAIFDSEIFTGYCYTQLEDVQQEKNGLLDEEGEYKADKEKLKEIFSRKY